MRDPTAVEALLADVQAGHPAAGARLFAAFGPGVRAALARFLALRASGRVDLVDDLTQDVFLMLLGDGGQKLRQFEGRNGCSFAGWLRVVAVRHAIDTLRRESRHVSLDGDTPGLEQLRRSLRSGESNPEDHVEGAETAARLREAIGILAPKDRLLVELHVLRGAALPEVARLLGVTMNAAYVRKSRVLERLRSSLRELA